jgi:hypothetical protein
MEFSPTLKGRGSSWKFKGVSKMEYGKLGEEGGEGN